MANHEAQLTRADRADLVAYLDGELDAVEQQRIEQLLVDSERACREVEALSGTWEALNLLRPVRASEQFTSGTLERIETERLHGGASPDRWGRIARRVTIVAGWCASLALAASVGFAVVQYAWPNPSQLLIEDLPLIEKLLDYREVGSIEFLKDLQTKGIDFESEHKPDGS